MPRRREWSESFDMKSVPFDVLRREWNTRAQALRTTFAGGRPAVIRACPFCKKDFAAAELRKHKPHCPKKKQVKVAA